MFRDPWPADRSWLKTIAGFSIPVLLVGSLGYRYLTTATPISADQALELYRAEAVQTKLQQGGIEGQSAPRPQKQADRPAARKEQRARSRATQAPVRARARVVQAAAPKTPTGGDEGSGTASSQRSTRRAPVFQPGAPEEGVYSWDTEGYESFNGSRRAFPRETQRIVTRHSDTSWTLHHYFSKERESWTDVSTTSDGYRTAAQRNKIVFGPVTRDATITFDPAMVTAPMPPRVGATWSGKWDGKTYGSYSGRFFEETKIQIEGEPVDVWGLELRIELHGETEGETWAQVWISPESHMVVREHYRQDVRTGPGSYKAEWLMTVKSLTPQR